MRAQRSGNVQALQLSSPSSAPKHFLPNRTSQFSFLAQVSSRIKYWRTSAGLCEGEQLHWQVIEIQETSKQVFFSRIKEAWYNTLGRCISPVPPRPGLGIWLQEYQNYQ